MSWAGYLQPRGASRIPPRGKELPLTSLSFLLFAGLFQDMLYLRVLHRSADGRDAVLGVDRHSFRPALAYVCSFRCLSLSFMFYLLFLIKPVTSPERLRLPHGLQHGTVASWLPLLHDPRHRDLLGHPRSSRRRSLSYDHGRSSLQSSSISVDRSAGNNANRLLALSLAFQTPSSWSSSPSSTVSRSPREKKEKAKSPSSPSCPAHPSHPPHPTPTLLPDPSLYSNLHTFALALAKNILIRLIMNLYPPFPTTFLHASMDSIASFSSILPTVMQSGAKGTLRTVQLFLLARSSRALHLQSFPSPRRSRHRILSTNPFAPGQGQDHQVRPSHL
jgi:hypothetical protein